MVEQVAKVRKPAPEFEAMAWWNGFKKVKLSDFKGKSADSRYLDQMLSLFI